jgi:hypothetical protein
MPAFGYWDGGVEPHTGFKVHVVNEGTVNDEGSRSLDSHRVVFHMGTGGVGRFSTRLHSIEVDVVSSNYGRVGGISGPIHVGGMADTGGVGSICQDPRPGRVVMVTIGCPTQSAYEIWATKLATGGNTIHFSPAVFDPATRMDPNAPTLLLLTGGSGCSREFYFGPVFTPNTDFTSRTGGLGYIATYFDGDPNKPMTQYKLTRNYCAPGVGPTN